jgi:hypothetical protein
MTKYRITIPVPVGYQKPPRHAVFYITTADPVELTQYDGETGEPTTLRIGNLVIEFEADEIELREEA